MRFPTSCLQCRLAKRRCQQQSASDKCYQCERRAIACSFAQTPSRRPFLLPSTSAPSCDGALFATSSATGLPTSTTSGGLTLSDDDVEHLVTSYFYYLHDRPHSLFHQATLVETIRATAARDALVYAICGLTASFSPRLHLKDRGPEYAAQARRLLLDNLEQVCLEHVQAAILLANVYAAALEPSSEALYFGIANRMAHILKLHVVNLNDNGPMRETKCRVWWSLVVADQWCSNGLGLPRQLHCGIANVPLPLDEQAFQALGLQDAPLDLADCGPGMWAFMITLIEIFVPIHDLNKRLVDEYVDENECEAHVTELARRLDAWLTSLPRSLLLSDENLDMHRENGVGGAFVGLHLGYHHYATLLYFQYLDLNRRRTKLAVDYSKRCKHHALSYSRLLTQSRTKGQCDAVYATVGHMTVVSSSVLLHTLLFGRDEELPETRCSLTANFSALIELKKVWPSLDRTTARLAAFQNDCLRSPETNIHKIDRWMVRFLLEHSVPLEVRRLRESDDVQSVSSPTHSERISIPSNRAKEANHAISSLWR